MIEEIQQEIEVCKKKIEQAQKAQKLQTLLKHLEELPEFKELFVEHYIKNQSLRLAEMISTVSVKANAPQHEMYLRELYAVGTFSEFMRSVHQYGEMAQASIDETRDEIAELEEQLAEEMVEQ